MVRHAFQQQGLADGWIWRPPKILGEATTTATSPSRGRGDGLLGTAKTVALFTLFALPVGLLLSKMQELRQIQTEKAAFHRLGLDWEKRFRSG